MNKFKILNIKGGITVLIFMLLTSPSFAALTVKDPLVKYLNGQAVSNGTVQVVIGGNTTTPNVPPDFITGTLHTTQFPKTNTEGIAVGTIMDLPLNKNVYLKAWDGDPKVGDYYGFFGPGNTGSATQTIRWDGVTIVTDYKAASPYQPDITKFEESVITLSDGTKTSTLKVYSAQPSPLSDGKREIATYAWKMWEEGAAEPEESLSDSNSPTLTLDSSGIDAGKTYFFKVSYANPFGKVWSESRPFATKVGAAGGSSFAFGMKAAKTDKVVVNSIAVPSNTLSDGSISKASELAAYINSKAGKTVVTVISKWDPETGQAVGVTFDSKGGLTAGAVDFAIIPGIGYQVFTTEDIDVTFSGI